jgi:hypothetical protein
MKGRFDQEPSFVLPPTFTSADNLEFTEPPEKAPKGFLKRRINNKKKRKLQ